MRIMVSGSEAELALVDVATLGILLYITSMWVSGILQGLMRRAYNALGFLQYSFVETVEAMHPFDIVRALGGFPVPHRRPAHGLQLWRTILGDEPGETPRSSRDRRRRASSAR